MTKVLGSLTFENWYSNNKNLSDKELAEAAWNAAVDAVDDNITYRSPELDADIWEMFTENH